MRPLTLLTALALLATFAPHISAQTTADAVKTRLTDKPLIMRGLWRDDKLKFGPSGDPDKKYEQTTFTVCGFEFTDARISGDTLRLTGYRIALQWHFDRDTHTNVLERKAIPTSSKDNSTHVEIRIEIHGTKDFTTALDKIFVTDVADLKDELPFYWQRYVSILLADEGRGPAVPRPISFPSPGNRKPEPRHTDSSAQPSSPPPTPVTRTVQITRQNESAPLADPKPPSSAASPAHIGGKVKAPVILQQVPPEFSEAARLFKFSGNVLIYAVVGTNGIPDQVQIDRPAGMGLDEQAVRSVQQYKFRPATIDGTPIRTDLFIEVNFQIF